MKMNEKPGTARPYERHRDTTHDNLPERFHPGTCAERREVEIRGFFPAAYRFRS